MMEDSQQNLNLLVETLNFREKIDRSLFLISDAYNEFGDSLVVANSLGKDSSVIWHLARKVNPDIRGFIVTTRFKPEFTKTFMYEEITRCPTLEVFSNNDVIPDNLYNADPDLCCDLLKVAPIRMAIEKMRVKCWMTGLRMTEGRTRADFREVEDRDRNLCKLNPILIWEEREIWQYLALYGIPVNPMYAQGYRSLGCAPCTKITSGDERSGRWRGTSKCGGECGIHTRPLKPKDGHNA